MSEKLHSQLAQTAHDAADPGNSAGLTSPTSPPPGEKARRLTEAHLIPQLTPIVKPITQEIASPEADASDWKSRRKKVIPG